MAKNCRVHEGRANVTSTPALNSERQILTNQMILKYFCGNDSACRFTLFSYVIFKTKSAERNEINPRTLR